LVLVNKSRKGKDVKRLIRHEKAHSIIEGVDLDGSIQEEVWNSMTVAEKERARQYIREDRNQPNMSEGEIRKEYLADAIANVGKNGVIDESKPKLPQPLVDRIINAKDMAVDEGVSVDKGKSFFALRKERKAMKKERKENIKSAKSEQVRQETEETLKKQASKDWSEMSDEQKDKFIIINSGKSYNQTNDEEAFNVYQDDVVNSAMNREEIKRQSEENEAIAKENDYYKTQEVINKTKTLFAKNYNTNTEKIQELNSNAIAAQQRASEARKAYTDPNNDNPKEAEATYQRENRNANTLRTEAIKLAKDNEKYRVQHEKEIKSLESLAGKQKAKAEKARDSVGKMSEVTSKTDTTKEATDSAQGASSSSVEMASKTSSIQDRVDDLSRVVSDKNSSKEQIQSRLQALEKEIEVALPEEEKNEPDNEKFLEELRKLLAQADNISSGDDEEAVNVIAGQMDQFLSNIPPGMLNAGKAKQNESKGAINIPKTGAGSFLSKPLSMAQFLAMKKWFEQQSSNTKKIGQNQSAFSGEMQEKIANVNQRISNINTSGESNVDMKVILEEEGLSNEEIEQIVSNYTSEQEDEE